jgi:hypothetical protein
MIFTAAGAPQSVQRRLGPMRDHGPTQRQGVEPDIDHALAVAVEAPD